MLAISSQKVFHLEFASRRTTDTTHAPPYVSLAHLLLGQPPGTNWELGWVAILQRASCTKLATNKTSHNDFHDCRPWSEMVMVCCLLVLTMSPASSSIFHRLHFPSTFAACAASCNTAAEGSSCAAASTHPAKSSNPGAANLCNIGHPISMYVEDQRLYSLQSFMISWHILKKIDSRFEISLASRLGPRVAAKTCCLDDLTDLSSERSQKLQTSPTQLRAGLGWTRITKVWDLGSKASSDRSKQHVNICQLSARFSELMSWNTSNASTKMTASIANLTSIDALTSRMVFTDPLSFGCVMCQGWLCSTNKPVATSSWNKWLSAKNKVTSHLAALDFFGPTQFWHGLH